MLVFFDESGDTGWKMDNGSSELFTVTMVVFEDHDEAQATDDRIALLRRELGKGTDYEFHFAKTPDPIRRAFFEAVAPHNFFFFSFVIAKRELDAKDWSSAEAFYRWVCGLIFESAKPHLDNAIVRLDESGGRGFRAQVGTDLKRQMNRDSGRTLVKKVVFSDSKANNLLQLVDMVCGAVARAQSENQKADFYRLIRHRQIWVRRWPEADK